MPSSTSQRTRHQDRMATPRGSIKLLGQSLARRCDDQPIAECFVPGRSIGDNILLAQEMFAGYNRQGLPKRCALKVDLRKAYDTVEWDFLIAALKMFGFPDLFIGWIEECVTTPMFSVCINGNPHGFFKGARGLRQGDPMSPFLFVLVMEVLQLMMQQLIDQNEGFSYHWRCKELGLFQLCFADDLLLFCKADVASVQVFRRGLDEFAKLSGLHANHTEEPAHYLPISTGRTGSPNCSSAVPGGSPPPQVSRPSSVSLTAFYLGLPTPPS
ncbi:UNVERIFIED_CONTAM: Retrovirus-related Pol polyprotein from type-2 retrotransposable element R2DM [Sesamum angustifolium]|uniref:Retrovirus-related Pol polyprotein from type-2 retrotransposable element R2DM n=1 Tax=Sesamum angustifolium TaxID=2727405 RepID=A0AAW2JGB1_9LAMI